MQRNRMAVPVETLKKYLDQYFPYRKQSGMDKEIRANALGITIVAYRKVTDREKISA